MGLQIYRGPGLPMRGDTRNPNDRNDVHVGSGGAAPTGACVTLQPYIKAENCSASRTGNERVVRVTAKATDSKLLSTVVAHSPSRTHIPPNTSSPIPPP